MDTQQRPKVSPLLLVDCALDPKMVYDILDALYENVVNKPEDNWEAITYLEDRLLDLNMPLAREVYETEVGVHPENEQYKRLIYWRDAEREDK